ncbi:WHG domain-containing protein [Chitinivorax sp. PXF-14]|uniref:TetR/AcrR family transcriptional regulator n=1 Tax=Chitinivorax sp. PXF-14 TaxID=3230488 RepID=UPI0034666C6A
MTEVLSNLQARKRREAETRKKHIIAVVKALIKKGGAREITIRKVAEQAGFSTTVVYSLFRDKATLITRAMDQDLLDLVKLMKKAVAASDDPIEQIRAAGRAYIQYGFTHPDEYALVFMERRPHAPVEAAVVEHGNPNQDPYAFAHSLFTTLADTGAVPADLQTTHLMTQIFWQGLHGMTSLSLVMDEGDEWTPKIAPQIHIEALLDVLLAGILQRFGGK